ncbi:MAG: Lin0512 family protein [Xanthobacteraceae bacterium]|nr:Lin0512 family protein [Xanthobacteraceae bacterium]
MPKTRVILELGSGNDLHGSDYTKAALRAVQDALHHSSLSFVRTLKIDKTKVDVEVTVGVQRPERIDLEQIKESLPLGNVTVRAVKGGLDVVDQENSDAAVIASAAIAVRIETA